MRNEKKVISMDEHTDNDWDKLLDGSSLGGIESLEIDYDNGLPVWMQVKNRLSYLIASGEYSAGDRLPTVRALAVDLDISYNTVNRAYMDLEREGYISTRKGRGTFVAEIDAKMIPAIDETVTALADEMIRAGANAGMSDDAILSMVRSRIEHKRFRAGV
ncbi:MAG: GntR family transcriptional regulator [Gordonibacter sp.]|nr:GntR family transcriptional regulator [Gordonibacter sp.]